jgi:DNA-binding Xre family transcriptional regulator
MPFKKVDPIAEAIELQEMFKDDPEAKEMFRQYELGHREAARIKQEELELRNRLVEMRKQKNITQKELELRTGMTQQAISRFEKGSGVNFTTILKYAEGIDCRLVPQSK